MQLTSKQIAKLQQDRVTMDGTIQVTSKSGERTTTLKFSNLEELYNALLTAASAVR